VGKLPDTNAWTLALGIAALVALMVARRVAPAVPMALIVVVGGIVLVALLGLADEGVAVIGVVEGAIPMPAIPRVEPGDFMALVPGALAIAVIGYAETNQVAESFAQEHKYEIRPNQELIAVGGSNLLAGLLQGFIVGGGASQSAAADRAGARTLVASLIVAGLTVLTSVFLLPLFRDLPQAVLGAIVISAVVGFLRVDSLRRIAGLSRDAFLMALFALGATLVLGILPGLITAVILTLILVLVHFATPSTSTMVVTPQGDGVVASARQPDATTEPGLLVVRLDGPIMFLNAKLLRDQVRDRIDAWPEPVRVVIIDLELSSELDIESLDTLIALNEQVHEQAAELWLSDVRHAVRDVLARGGISGEGPGIRIFASTMEAITAYRQDGRGS
jgi:MFS superfamily sulfate permease-like transporter